jgi:VWFA-related protein
MSLFPRVRRHAVSRLLFGAAAFLLLAGDSRLLSAQGAAGGAATLTVDVQVVDREGQPMAGITPDKFNVEVNGRRRRVLEARQIDAAGTPGTETLEGRRVYFLAVDASTFGVGASAGAIGAMTAFIRTLPADSLLGLVTFPAGPSVELTTDHATVMTALASVAGQRQPMRSGQFGLGASDVMEYLSSSDRTEIARRYCGAELSEDSACPQLLEQEANAVVNGLETQARSSLGMISDFATRLRQITGRKVVVLASAGLAVAARSGGRPDVGNLPTELAEAVTRSDIAFYTLMLDRLQDSDQAQNARQSSNASADREALGRWLDQFSTSMGGALVRVQVGQEGDAVSRIAKETTSFYQLTLESIDADTAERPQRLRVRVDERGATVRARTLVKGR